MGSPKELDIFETKYDHLLASFIFDYYEIII